MAPRDTKKLLDDEVTFYGTLNIEKYNVPVETYKKPKQKKIKHGLLQIFQYASLKDVFLILIGALSAIIQGSSFPILSIIFGQMTNSFIQQATSGFDSTIQNNLTSSIGTSSIDAISLEEFDAKMILYSKCYLVIAVVVLATAFLQTFCWELIAEHQVYRLRKIFFSQLLRQDISWYDQNESVDLSSKLSDDLERIREGLGCKFSLVIQYLSTFVSGLLVGFYVNWRLTSMIITVGPFLIGTSAYLAKVSSNSAAREQMKYAIAGGIAKEVLSNIRTVAAFCKEYVEMKRYKKALDDGRKIAMEKYLILSVGLGIVFFIMYAAYGFAFYYGASLVADGTCTPGSIFTVFFSVMAGAFSVGNALPFINSVSTAVGCADSVFKIVRRVPKIDPYSEKGVKPRFVNGYIEFKHLSFKYPSRPDVEVLHDLSLKIDQGKIVAFVGASGAGKSTILGLFLRFYDPVDGVITLDGTPLNQLNVNWLRNQIGVVAQEPVLFSASIADNIRYGRPDISDEEIEEAARIANAHYFISKLPEGYNTLAGDCGSQLSGGQKQRIAIARALARNPKILLLDEATSALDSHGEGIVQEALEKAMFGRTTIIIAHRLSTVRNADLIYVMKDGYIAESGKHQELISRKGLYYNLILAQTLDKSIDEKTVRNWNEEDELENRFVSTMSLNSRSSSLESFEWDNNVVDNMSNEQDLPQVSVWQLVKFNSKEWLRLTVGIIACAVTGVVMPIFSIFYTEMFVTFTLPKEQLKSTALFWGYMLIILATISGTAMFTQTICMTSAAEKLIMRMRSKAFNSILRQPVSWFDLESSSTGYLITRLSRDAPLVKAAAGLRVGHMITASVTMGSGIFIAFLFGWKLAMLLIFGVPFIAGAAYQQNMILKKSQFRDSRLMEIAGKIVNECVQNIRTVQALSTEKLFVRKYTESLDIPFREAKKHAATFGLVFSFSQSIIYLMYAAAFKYGAQLVETGEMTPTDVYRVFFALAFCATAVGNTFSYMQDFIKAKHAARLMMQLINKKSEIDPMIPSGVKPVIKGKLKFNEVHFTYPARADFNVLRGLTFSLDSGKMLALVGESGCGKSTVVSLLERFYNPCRGQIDIDDYDISTINLHHLRRNIGIVTQEPNLFDRTIRDNIAYGLLATENETVVMQKVIQAAKSVNIHNFVASLPQGYDTMVGEKGAQLSGGQKQRIAIARALIKNPKILLLDEATSALDTECEKVVQEALDKAREGRTCITIAHRLSTIQNADVIAVVHKGRIIEYGTHEDLVDRKGYYFKLTERQQI